MGMQMTGSSSILSVPSEHVPGLIALVLFPIVAWCVVAAIRAGARRGVRPAMSLQARIDALPFVGRVALVSMLAGAAVHAAIVPTHWGDSTVLAILFVADAVGFVAVSAWVLVAGRHWRLLSAGMLAGTVAGYLFYLAKGWETADLVGLVITAVELVGALMLIMPERQPTGNHAVRRMLWTSIPVAAAALVGTVALVGAPSVSAANDVAGSPHRSMPAMKGGPSSGPMSGMAPDSSPSGSMPAGEGSGTSSTMPGMDPSSAPSGAIAPAGSDGSSSAMPGMSAPSGASSGTGGAVGGMPAMPGGTSGSSGSSLSLATTSPAGPITWPLPMGAMEPGMQMVTPDCTAAPSTAQQRAAVSLVDQTVTAAQRYESLANARADGYVPITPTGRPIVHYAKPGYVNDGQLLDPNAIESLVYANTPHGAILVAAMYLMGSNQGGATPPMPGGCLTEWHVHTDLCFSNATGAVVGTDSGGSCPAGSTNHVSQPMIHVWLAPVPGGPLVVDASNAQVQQAAAQLPTPNPPNSTA